MWEVINNILAIIGLISLIMTIIRIIWIFCQNSEWIDNIRIEEHPLDKDFDMERGFYPLYYPEHPSCIEDKHATQNLFIPQNTIIRNAVIKKVVFTGDPKKPFGDYKKVYKVKEISPHSPLCLVIPRTQAIPTYMIEWKTEYGGKTQYYFGDNLRNDDNSLTGFQYHYGIMSKIRKVFGLR